MPASCSGSTQQWAYQGKPGPPSLRTLYVGPGWVLRRPRPTGNESSVCPEYETAGSFRLPLWGKRGWWAGRCCVPVPAPRAGPTQESSPGSGSGAESSSSFAEVLGQVGRSPMCAEPFSVAPSAAARPEVLFCRKDCGKYCCQGGRFWCQCEKVTNVPKGGT